MNKIKIPLVVGVAASSNLGEIPAAAKKMFRALVSGMPHTPLEFIVTGGLNELVTGEVGGGVEEGDEDAIVENANILVVLGKAGECPDVVDKWRKKLLDNDNGQPFASNRTDLVVYCDGEKIVADPPFGKTGGKVTEEPQLPDELFAHREQSEVLKFIELFNKEVRNDPDGTYSQIVDERQKIADNLSSGSQKVYRREFVLLFSLLCASGILINIYSGMDHAYGAQTAQRFWGCSLSLVELTLPAYLVIFVLMLGCYLFIKFRGSDRKYVEFRMLAEALRVQGYWHLGGIGDDVADHVLQTGISRMEPTAVALRNWRRKDEAFVTPTEPNDGAVSDWIDGQIKYYDGGIRKRETKRRRVKCFAIAAYVFSLTAAILYFTIQSICGSAAYEFGPLCWSTGDGMWLSVGNLLFALAAYFIEKNAWDEEIESFKSALKMFRAIKELWVNGTIPKERLLLTLGKEALKEHESWLKLHRGRKPTPTY